VSVTLDDFAITTDWRVSVRELAQMSGPRGFTADDLKNYADLNRLPRPTNPGSILGALVARGVLTPVGDESSVFRSSKGRRVRRFVLAEGSL
jgi:hypothetical protein